MTTGLILSGGGARAAYQVGVLKAVSEILPKEVHNPFPVICGTSAGAINALAIAGRPGHFRLRMKKLEAIWYNLEPDKVYRTDFGGVLKNGLNVLLSFLHSGYGIGKPISLLDTEPLREMLNRVVRFRYVDEAIASGELEAVSVTSMNYTTGQSVTFFQGNDLHKPWARARRIGIRSGLEVDHLLASSAIPTLFPARKIGDNYYGDGAVRQLKPISPALHLGASRVFVIGVSDNPTHTEPSIPLNHSPSIAQIVGHMFNSAFIDSIESDLETLQNINRVAEQLSPEEREENGVGDLKPIDFLAISPSEPIDKLASDFIKNLPTSIKIFLRITGATAHGGGVSAASYLLFEKGFCRKLLELGYKDGMEKEDEIKAFFGTL